MARVGIVHSEIVVPPPLFFSGGGLTMSIDKCLSFLGGRVLSGTVFEGGELHCVRTSVV